MRIAGIIAEYDPFHKGHAAHINATRQDGGATHVVAVLSGSFTQRGEPASFTKFQRTKMALAGGADLVLELPVPWSMASAERFATGGVALLQALGCVEMLSFGSECGNVIRLEKLAALPDTEEYKTALRRALDTGIPYAAARQAAAAGMVDEEEAALLSSPNNTLGLEYIRAARALGADFSFFSLARQGALHHENAPNSGFASGTLLRKLIKEGNLTEAEKYMPESSFGTLKKAVTDGLATVKTEKADIALLAQLRRMTPEDMAGLPYLSEGLENRLYKAAQSAGSYEELIHAVKTRRYPLSRIRRVVWAAMLGMGKADGSGLPPYIRVLGMNDRGREILSAASPTLPLLTRPAQLDTLDAHAQRVFHLENTATNLHALLLPTPQPCGSDYTQKLLSL